MVAAITCIAFLVLNPASSSPPGGWARTPMHSRQGAICGLFVAWSCPLTELAMYFPPLLNGNFNAILCLTVRSLSLAPASHQDRLGVDVFESASYLGHGSLGRSGSYFLPQTSTR